VTLRCIRCRRPTAHRHLGQKIYAAVPTQMRVLECSVCNRQETHIREIAPGAKWIAYRQRLRGDLPWARAKRREIEQ